MKHAGHETWVWVATDVKTKLIPIIRVDDRSQKAAYQVIHELKQCLRPVCVPAFSSYGLKAYFYGLTAYIGKWAFVSGKRRPVWVLLPDYHFSRYHESLRKGLKNDTSGFQP